MDVCMPREDYDRLVSMADEFQSPFELQITDIQNETFFPFVKIRNNKGTMLFKGDAGKQCNHGVWVDVFPLDNVPDDKRKWERQAKKIEFYRYLCHAYVYRDVFYRHYEDKVWKWNLARCWAIFLCRIKSFKWLNEKFLEAAKMANKEKTQRTGICADTFSDGEGQTDYCNIYKEDYEELVYLDFEYLKVPAPKGWHRYLENTYGDYMELPSISRRRANYLENVIVPNTPWQQFDFSVYTDIFGYGKGKDFLLFGGGNACDLFLQLYRKKCNIVAIYDNNKDRWGTTYQGIPVRSPNNLKEDMSENSLVVITSSYDREIGRQLKEMGISEYRCYIYGRYY